MVTIRLQEFFLLTLVNLPKLPSDSDCPDVMVWLIRFYGIFMVNRKSSEVSFAHFLEQQSLEETSFAEIKMHKIENFRIIRKVMHGIQFNR
ncbi:MAG: hypothetical protein P0116_05480 [Candidatus Nitrosocosmicus sp.]|nr:hypothetical protein [Candidatus Nitrosocosmicus sp.]